jgi:hypothetical protein
VKRLLVFLYLSSAVRRSNAKQEVEEETEASLGLT